MSPKKTQGRVPTAINISVPVPEGLGQDPMALYSKGFFAQVIVAVRGPDGKVEEATVIAFIPRVPIPEVYMGLEYDAILRPELPTPFNFQSLAGLLEGPSSEE